MTERTITAVVAGALTVYLTDRARGLTILPMLSEGALTMGTVIATLAVVYVCYLVGGFFASCRAVDRERRDGGGGGDRLGGAGGRSRSA